MTFPWKLKTKQTNPKYQFYPQNPLPPNSWQQDLFWKPNHRTRTRSCPASLAHRPRPWRSQSCGGRAQCKSRRLWSHSPRRSWALHGSLRRWGRWCASPLLCELNAEWLAWLCLGCCRAGPYGGASLLPFQAPCLPCRGQTFLFNERSEKTEMENNIWGREFVQNNQSRV